MNLDTTLTQWKVRNREGAKEERGNIEERRRGQRGEEESAVFKGVGQSVSSIEGVTKRP